jgi:C1A family cysteine protease
MNFEHVAFYALLATILIFLLTQVFPSAFKVKKRRRYTWKVDHTDPRDHLYTPAPATLAPHVDLTSGFPVAFDQGRLGSCTGNAWAGALAFLHCMIFKDTTPWSRLMIYYGERWIEGTIRSDAGAMIRDGAKFLAKYGVCSEALWPYVISKFRTKPPAQCWNAALPARIVTYSRITTLDGILACLNDGHPVVFGFTVYESFESDAVARTGVVPMPAAGEQTLGGHAVVAVGYDLPSKRLLVRNSWGPGWGQKGYFTMPFEYITKPGLADDFWTVRK